MRNKNWIAVTLSSLPGYRINQELLWQVLALFEPLGAVESSDGNGVIVYFSPDTYEPELPNKILALLQGTGIETRHISITVSELENQNWNENWRQYFVPTPVGTKYLILPPWEEAKIDRSRIPIIIEPGMAFGTGTHATTQLCLQAMEAIDLQDLTILDVGTGSGILGIAAILAGARWCLGIDIDPDILENANINRNYNKIPPGKFDIVIGNLASLRRKAFDVVFCNMLPQNAFPLLSVIGEFMHERSILIYSGFLTEETETIRAELARNGFDIQDLGTQDEWAVIRAKLS